MAYYAFLDENNVVTEVIAGRDEWEIVDEVSDWEEHYGSIRGQRCVRTSYNGTIRKQYAGIGFSFDPEADVFIAPKPFPSWILNASYDWEAPIPRPEGDVRWDEDEQAWIGGKD
jgi:hypothetical protein